MKRSEYIAIGAIGLLVVATFWPSTQSSAPPEDPVLNTDRGSGFTTLAFASLDECRATQAVTEQECRSEWGKAQETSIADAPKYDALADCESEYGANQCRPASWNGASVFVPALAGVLIARSLAGAASASQPLYPPRTGPQSCPPGVNLAERPECQARSSSSSGSSSSSSGGSSSRSYYSTGSGRSIGRVAGSVLADAVLPSRTTVSRTTSLPRGGTWSSSSSSSSSRSSTGSWSSSSSTTSSRGGFGSSSSSFGSSSS
jgi:hypothetical protein